MATSQEIDYLTEDPVISAQKYACISVFTPDTIGSKSEERQTNRAAYKKQLNELKNAISGNESAMASLKKLEETMNTLLDTRRSFKVRGVYDTFEDAQKRCQQINSFDKYFNVFIGEVGKWLPWEDDPEKAKDVQYANKELNNLMKEYMQDQEKSKMYHEQRKNDLIAKALQENEKKKSDNKKEKKSISELIEKKLEDKKSKLQEEKEVLESDKSSLQQQQELLEKLKAEAEAIKKELGSSQ